MPKTRSYKEELLKSLQKPKEAESYLNAALLDEDPEVFLLAIRDVAEATLGGMTKLSQKTKLNRENLYRIFSDKGNPELESLNTLLDALGFRLAVELKKAS